MEEHKLTELLRQESTEVTGQTPFCPEDQLIVGYFEGSLPDRERAALKRHLLDCRFCMARVGNLERLGDEKDFTSVSGSVLADAKRLAKSPLPKRTRHAPVWAAAAVVVLALFTTITLGPRSGSDTAATNTAVQQAPEESRQLRSIDPAAHTPRIISPAEGDRVEPGDLTVRWTEVRGSLHYDVRVVTAEGLIVWNDRIEGATEWKPPVNHLLEPGMAYYVRVDAYLAAANNVSSEHILFTVGERKE